MVDNIDFNYLIKNFDKLSCNEKNQAVLNIKINWKQILPNLKLNENLLELYADQLNWYDVFHYQINNLSKEFIQKHKFRINE
jgi:hypothetical protein